MHVYVQVLYIDVQHCVCHTRTVLDVYKELQCDAARIPVGATGLDVTTSFLLPDLDFTVYF